MPSLIVIRGKDSGAQFQVDEPRMTIGRDPQNHIWLKDHEVSRRHASLENVRGQVTLTDLASSNGTFVNSRKIQSHVLHHGDRLQVGTTLMLFHSVAEQPSSKKAMHVEVVSSPSIEGRSEIRQSIPTTPWLNELNPTDPQHAPGAVSPSDSLTLHPMDVNLGEMIYQISLTISRTMDIDQLLAQILSLVFEWIQCDRGCILLWDNESQSLQPAFRKNRTESKESQTLEISQTILDYVWTKNEGILTRDAGLDDRWEAGQSILRLGIREAICVPMQGRYGMVGILYVDTTRSPKSVVEANAKEIFSRDHLKLLIAIGHQSAVALEDTNYYQGMLQAERLAIMGHTIATLSHHIKNILQGLQSGSFLVNDGLRKQDLSLVAKGWGIVDRNRDRIASMVMDMLSFSKERIPDLSETDLRETIDDVVALALGRASEGKVELEWNPPGEPSIVRFDPEGIHRALYNVLQNAIDACSGRIAAKVQVRMAIDHQGQQASIYVEDNGPGIEPSRIEAIFQPFESSKGNRGTGLGLSVSRKIMREHGGDIGIHSEPGVTTCFHLWWPLRKSPTEHATASG